MKKPTTKINKQTKLNRTKSNWNADNKIFKNKKTEARYSGSGNTTNQVQATQVSDLLHNQRYAPGENTAMPKKAPFLRGNFYWCDTH